MIRRIFILIPSPHPTGPVKGAVALANALASIRQTTLVALKTGPGVDAPIHPEVEWVSLSNCHNWLKKLRSYRQLLRAAGGRDKTASISLCFSADLINLLCRRETIICSSVRGNLPKNYRFDYGLKGVLLALTHLFLLRWFDHVVAMTDSMAIQVARYTGRRPRVVGNFVDETFLERYRSLRRISEGQKRFIYVGSLTKRKQIRLLILAAAELKQKGERFQIDLVGDGILRPGLTQLAAKLDVNDMVTFHGYLREPFARIAQAHCLVSPSTSEGLSRAVLEALFLGVPCLLRDADGHREIIQSGQNGFLFANDHELLEHMLSIANWSSQKLGAGENLLPNAFRQTTAAREYLALLET